MREQNSSMIKIGVLLRKPNRCRKPDWKIRLEGKVKKLRQPVKGLRKEKHMRVYWYDKTTTK